MKKVTKATIAAVAAGALLLGGAGTVALWQQNANVDAGSVSTGHLKLTTGETGTWQDVSNSLEPTAFDPKNDTLVPGDVVTFDQFATIEAEGKNLQGALTVGTAAAVPDELADDVTVGLDIDSSAEGLSKDGNVVSFSEEGSYKVPLKITVTFKKGTVASTEDVTMDKSIDLTKLSLVLDQVRP